MSVKGFIPLDVTLPKVANLSESFHTIYMKPHLSKLPEEQIDTTRSLFLVNIIPNWTTKLVKDLFSQISKGSIIEKVLVRECIDKSRLSETNGINYDIHINLSMLVNDEFGQDLTESEKLPFGCSVVKFIDRDAMELFVKEMKKIKKGSLVWHGNSKDYSKIDIINTAELEREISKKISSFEKMEKDVEEEVQGMREIVDEDGFTLVVGSQRKTKNSILGSIQKKEDLEKNKEIMKKEKKKEKQDFYRFQIRERKKQEINQLLNKFKQDQQRVNEMREKRKFRPY